MKTIGLLGGMSWESTLTYYRIINQETKRLRGGLHSAPIVLVSVDFKEVETLQAMGDWQGAAHLLIAEARHVERAGADCLVICTNTMHKVADEIQNSIDIPLLHIADATAGRLTKARKRVAGLLGTKFTMEEDFYRAKIELHGIRVLIPSETDRNVVHTTIYQELCLGKILPSSRDAFVSIINRLQDNGAEAIIAGCTEISLLLQQNHCDLPLFDTARIHAEACVAFALK